MTGLEVMDVARDAMWVLLIVTSPPMIVGLVVGLIIALFQALTQIQEMTLTFVPKIIAIFLTLIVTMPFMAGALGDFMERIAARIVAG